MQKEKEYGNKEWENLFRILPERMRRSLIKSRLDYRKLQEIRLRINGPVYVFYDGKEYLLAEEGGLGRHMSYCLYVTEKDICECMEYISNHSRYAYEEELRQGFITVKGGHRIGVAGKMSQNHKDKKGLGQVTFLNIRVAHEVKDCATEMLPYLYQDRQPLHTLIISSPGSGKTTLLRDIIRQMSDGNHYGDGVTVGVVDERSEIAACYRGVPQNDIGRRTDVLDHCSKVQGMMMLIRSMAPKILAVDEIGSQEELQAIAYAMNCGITLLATVHGRDLQEIESKPGFEAWIKGHYFRRFILLSPNHIGRVEAVYDERGCTLFRGKKEGETSIAS